MLWSNYLDFFKEDKIKECIKKINDNNTDKKAILPLKDFSDRMLSLKITKPEKTNVVMIGKEPAPSKKLAAGLCFSTPEKINEFKNIPDATNNLFKELNDDLKIKRNNPNLTDWGTKGVLMLNRSLTTLEKQSGSHLELRIWEPLIEEILKKLSNDMKNIVFILLGKHARELEMYIQNKDNHFILSYSHPHSYTANYGFFGSKIFSKTNEYLISKNKNPIDWSDSL